MKIKKKTAMLLSFALGSTLFVTTAFAEVNSKSGYDQLKDALKHTSKSLSETLSSYTMDVSYVIKDNGAVLSSRNEISKYDVEKQATENTSTGVDFNDEKYNGYQYGDKTSIISYNPKEDSYFVSNFDNIQTGKFSDPFKENGAADIERIIDALVGNLKDYVVVNDNNDGVKELSGSLKEAQIPAIVNAVASYGFKQNMTSSAHYANIESQMNSSTNKTMPILSKDIFVEEASGKVTVDKDGLIQSILATGILSGKDKDDKEHNITYEMLAKIRDINSTVVTKPDLTGKKVIESNSDKDGSSPSTINTKLYVGKFKNDIIIQKDNQFVKVGERFIDIENNDGKTISGRYHEEFKAGFEDYAKNKQDFNFSGPISDGGYTAEIKNTYSNGGFSIYLVQFDMYSPRLFVHLQTNGEYNNIYFDNNFSKVFE